MSTPAWAWWAWIAAFAVLEGIGLASARRGDTLWLVGHLGFGIWTL